MQTQKTNTRLVLLWEVEFEHNSGSEYEHSERRWFWETTLNKANKAVINWLHENGYKFSQEARAYSNESNRPSNVDFVRFSIEQATLLHVENGSSMNLEPLNRLLDYNQHSNGFFERS